MCFEVGVRVVHAAERVHAMKNVQWKKLYDFLNSEFVDRAEELHNKGSYSFAEAIIEIGRRSRLEQEMHMVEMSQQPFG